jgi:hypothetical protein
MDGGETEALDATELAAIEAELPEEQRLVVQDYWEWVIMECRAELADAPRPASWRVARPEMPRRVGHGARRAVVAVVRELSGSRAAGSGGSEAA